MPDINLLKNTEKYDPITPRPTPPSGTGPLSEPVREAKGLGSAFRSLFSRRPKPVEPMTPTLGKALGTSGKMSLGRNTAGERILNEKKSKPAMIQLPEEEDSFNVNLLGQDIGQALTLRRQLMKLGFTAVGAIIAVVLMYVGLTLYSGTITTDINDTTAKIDALKVEIGRLQTTQTEIADTTKKITAIRSLIDRHVHWTKFFAELEKSTSPEVFYGTSFTGDLNGAVTLAARAPSFDAVATQYLFFRQAQERGGFIQSFDITGATMRESKTGPEVSFSIGLRLAPEVFYVTATEATTAPATETPPTTAPTTEQPLDDGTTNLNTSVPTP